MPKTKLGKWSFYLVLVMPVLFILTGTIAGNMYDSIPAGDTIWEDMANRPLIVLTALSALGTGLASLGTGLIAIIKEKEKSWLVYLSTGIGFLILMLLLGEFIFSH